MTIQSLRLNSSIKFFCLKNRFNKFNATTVAIILDSNRQTISSLCRSGDIKAYKKLRKWYILESDLIDWITNEF